MVVFMYNDQNGGAMGKIIPGRRGGFRQKVEFSGKVFTFVK